MCSSRSHYIPCHVVLSLPTNICSVTHLQNSFDLLIPYESIVLQLLLWINKLDKMEFALREHLVHRIAIPLDEITTVIIIENYVWLGVAMLTSPLSLTPSKSLASLLLEDVCLKYLFGATINFGEILLRR